MNTSFENYLSEIDNWKLTGWDFDKFKHRWNESEPSWNYQKTVQSLVKQSKAMLDMGTGGGEFLASLNNRPNVVYATEAYEPNIPIAKKRLEPLGITVIGFKDDSNLPIDSKQFDLIINRHEAFEPSELYRLLTPGGRFITQQVGGRDNEKLNELLSIHEKHEYYNWNLANAVSSLKSVGFIVNVKKEEFPETQFMDIGAVTGFLKSIPWQFPGFSINTFRKELHALHKQIEQNGPLTINSHRFYLEAMKPKD